MQVASHTRKLPQVYPNPHDASPLRASAHLGSSFLRGVSLSRSIVYLPDHLAQRIGWRMVKGRSCYGSFQGVTSKGDS